MLGLLVFRKGGRNMIKIKGNLLMFDKLDLIGYIFPKECKIDIPEFIPITYPEHTQQVGKVTKVERDDTSIRIEGEIITLDEKAFQEVLSEGSLHASGYYNGIRVPKDDGVQVLESMTLKSVGLTLCDVYGDGSLRLEED